MTHEEIAAFFNDTRAFIQGNPDLRDPQVEGWFHMRQHLQNSPEHAILQIPVGCGKTGLTATENEVASTGWAVVGYQRG